MLYEVITLAKQFPLAPPAKGQPSQSLITYVTDRAGHDRRYAVGDGTATLVTLNPTVVQIATLDLDGDGNGDINPA